MTVPARADVNITAVQVGDTNEVIISYDATSEPNLIRAFAFDIQLDNDANIVSVSGLSIDYWVYPGSIQITADGRITDIGSIGADYADLPGYTLLGPPDANGVTLEAASLYAPVGPGSPNSPYKTGDLASIIVSGDTCLSIRANVPRAGATGVVMEDPNELVTVNYPPACIPIDVINQPVECLKSWAPEYPTWVQWGRPPCWCYQRQCNGDADGIKSGPFWVGIPELSGFRAAFNKTDLVLANITNGICYDCDHNKTGPFRVGIPDLDCLRRCFNKPHCPCCDLDGDCILTPEDKYNFWETP